MKDNELRKDFKKFVTEVRSTDLIVDNCNNWGWSPRSLKTRIEQLEYRVEAQSDLINSLYAYLNVETYTTPEKRGIRKIKKGKKK